MWHNISFSFTVLSPGSIFSVARDSFLPCRLPFFSPPAKLQLIHSADWTSSCFVNVCKPITCDYRDHTVRWKAGSGGTDSSDFLGNCSCPGESASRTLPRALLRFFLTYPSHWVFFLNWPDRAGSSARRDSPGAPKGHFRPDQNMLMPLHHITSASAASSALTISLIFFIFPTERHA